MKRLINTLLVSFCLLCPASLNAYDFMVDGIAYEINSDAVSVSVTYTNSSNNYPGLDGTVFIPDSVCWYNNTYAVISIGSGAFKGSYIEDVVIPSTVTSIEYGAFANCQILKYVGFAGNTSLSSIGEGAFYNCQWLRSIWIPNSVMSIGASAFENCPLLSSISVGDSVTSIGSKAFEGTAWYNNQNNGLVYAGPMAYKYKGTMPAGANLIIKDGTNGISDACFYGCNNLASVTIPNSVTHIGGVAFSNCSSLVSVNIPNSVVSISESAFSGCNGLTGMVVASGNTTYDSRNNCNAIIETTSNTLIFGCMNSVIPNSITSIGDYAFSGCSGLSSIAIPNSVISIGKSAFSSCGSLVDLSIGYSVSSIGDYAFYNCKGLTSVIIPYSVTSIGKCLFEGCSGLKTVHWEVEQCTDFDNNSAPFWGLKGITEFIFGERVDMIPAYLCYGLSGLTTVNITNHVVSIGEHSFSSCSGLKSVSIPNSVKTIGNHAFYECSSLTNVTIGNSVTSIGYNAFSGCGRLNCVTMGNSVRTIHEKAFYACNALKSVQINDLAGWCKISFDVSTGTNPLEYAGHLFLHDNEVKNLIIPNSVMSIKDYSFIGCDGLTGVTIPNSVTSIGKYAFCACDSLSRVTIPNSVTSIGERAFLSCSNLTSIYCHIKDPCYVDLGTAIFLNVPHSKCRLFVPKGTRQIYSQANQWKEFIIREYGDVTGDGNINVSDVTALVNMILGVIPRDMDATDINNDTKVNVSDVTALINHILGIS